MPIKLSWYVEGQVMLLVNSGESSDQDMFDVDQPIINYLNQSKAPLVHMIIDNRGSKYTPSVKAVTQVKWPKHPQYGWTILVGLTNPFQRFVNVVANNFFKTRQRMFDTMDEALDFLNEIDSTLPMLRKHSVEKAS